jgi:hypothetical protein
MREAKQFTNEELQPLQSIEQWEDDVLKRYPEEAQPSKAKEEYRNYDNPGRDTVREFYRLNHKYQTYDFVLEKKNEFLQFNRKEMPVWGAMEFLNTLVDDSDPDIDLDQLQHLLQTAEAIRADGCYNPASIIIGITRAEGVTSVGAVPSGGLISGQSAWADLDGATAADAIAQGPLALHVNVGALDGDRGRPAASLLRIREAFDDARTFQKNKAAWERNQSRPFSASRLDLEALGDALSGKIPVVFGVDRASDILAVLGLSKEFDLRPIIAGGAEAWKVAARLAEAKVPVIVNPIEPGPTSFDALGTRDDNAALLHAAGVPVVLTTGDTHNSRKLRQLAGNAVRAGLPHEAAISAITRAPAEALGLGAKYGTITAGKVANLVVWSGDPLEISTRPLAVVIRGKRVSLDNRQSALLSRYRRLPVAR